MSNQRKFSGAMRAAVCKHYGPPEVVTIAEVPKPVPGDNEILIKSSAVTVNSGDARVRALRVPRGLGILMRLKLGFRGPKQPVLGLEVAGEVEQVGRNVTAFHPGDRVVASNDFAFGCHAEYVIAAQDGAVAKIPEKLDYQAAVSLCFGGVTALYFFRLGQLEQGETVLINGASGAVGTMAVQIAKHLGAEVTAVCGSDHVELMKRLGADHVIDYKKENFTQNGQRYDIIMDTHGNTPYKQVRRSLKPGGRFLMVIGSFGQMIAASWQKAVVGGLGGTEEYSVHGLKSFQTLLSLAEQGKLKPVIDSTLPFEDIVEAYTRVDGGHKAGSIVLTF